MPTKITFVGETDEMVNSMRALGIGRPGEPIAVPCPYQVGDFISYPSAPGLAFRVTYRLYSGGDESKQPEWFLGLEKAPHPLAPPSAGGLHRK